MIGSTRDNSCFTPPPLDLPLEFVLDFHFKENPNHPVLTCPTSDEKCFKTYTYKDFVPAVHRAGHIIPSSIKCQRSAGVSPVVVILLKTDTATYLTVIAGLMRAGFTAFPISPRFSHTVVAHLLKESRPVALVVDATTRVLANETLKEWTEEYADRPLLCELPPFATLYSGHDTHNPLPRHERKPEDISIITHSSSTSSIFPKVISYSSTAVTHHAETKDMPVRELVGRVIGCFALELFHSFGMCVFFMTVRRGCIMGVMDPMEPTSILPADVNDVFRCFEATQPDFLMTSSRTLELWAEDPKKVSVLGKSSAMINFGGRFLNKGVGDRLVRNGVKICCCYGGTEIGPITVLPHFQGEDWEYFTVHPHLDLNFIPRSDGLVELIVAPTNEPGYLGATNTTRNKQAGYNPGDLFVPHPTKSHTYKMFGRLTDQILLATGEAINPLEIESELSRHPLISSAIVFGHSRFRPGVVIEPNAQANNISGEIFLDEIWPAIQEINLNSPPYASISRNMVVVAHSKKPISLSPKGLPRRPIVWLQYQDEIDALYVKDLRVHN